MPGVKGTLSDETTIAIIFLPGANISPMSQAAIEGGEAEFSCKGRDADSVVSPDLNIEWFIENRQGIHTICTIGTLCTINMNIEGCILHKNSL